jgi:hypothetical protein
MGQSKKINDRLDDLLAMQERHKQSAWTCPDCGAQPLTSRDLLGQVFVVDAEAGMCVTCEAKLAEVGETYVETWLPRGLDDPDAAD